MTRLITNTAIVVGWLILCAVTLVVYVVMRPFQKEHDRG